jgi:hypothetical protein
MSKLPKRPRRRNSAPPSPLPLFEFGERQRWAALPLAARITGRRLGIASAALALTIAELAGIGGREDR